MGRSLQTGSTLGLVVVISLIATVGCSVRRPPPLPPHAIRPIVAATSFEDRSSFDGKWRLDREMANQLVAELVWCDRFSVVERVQLGKVVGELDVQKTDYFRTEGRVRSGQLKGARYLIHGTIDDFSQIAGGSLSFGVHWLLFGGRGYTARCSVTLSVVDVESGVVVSSVRGSGTAAAWRAYSNAIYDGVAFGGDLFYKTPLGVATREALRKAVVGIAEFIPATIWGPLVADVVDGRVIVNGGHNHGLRVGDRFRVLESPRLIYDPITGDQIGQVPGREVGSIVVRKVEEKLATADVIRGDIPERGAALQRSK